VRAGKYALLAGGFIFSVFLSHKVYSPTLPSKKAPILIYSNQTGDDLKKIYHKTLRKVKKSIFLQIYGLTDSDLIRQINELSQKGITTQVFYDPSGSGALQKKIPKSIPIIMNGLMHKKILIKDDKTILIGTANLTPTSLCMHDNVVIGLRSKELGYFLKHSLKNKFLFTIGKQEGIFWHLPDFQNECLKSILTLIEKADSSIRISLFTFTHPKIIDALISAKKRGVSVQVALDFYAAKGASKKASENLEEAGIPLYISKGGKLLHHKLALIDQKTLLLGSANWTKSAFEKNEDCILTIYDLSNAQRKHFDKIWKEITLNSNPK
jgi:cardiolipin synthase A/B